MPFDPDDLPLPDFLDISPATIRAMNAVQHENRLERMEEAFRALVELRRRFAGFSKRLVVMVYVPQCEQCYADERHRYRMEEDTWKPPSILAGTWRRDLREYGATDRDLRRYYRLSKDPDIDRPLIRCGTCRGEILYGKENVYVRGVAFEDYFPELVGVEDRDPPRDPPEYVRRLAYQVYGGKCAGCGIALTPDQTTMDHIRPKHVGGPGTLENIQPACEDCNKEKGGLDPERVHIWLDFLLIPPGPELHEFQRLMDL